MTAIEGSKASHDECGVAGMRPNYSMDCRKIRHSKTLTRTFQDFDTM